MPIWNKAVIRLIKIPYWIALGLISLSVTASFVATLWAIDRHRSRFEIVEMAARQRLYSQRIPFLASELVNATDAESRQVHRRALHDAIRNTKRRHDILSLQRNSERVPAGMRAILQEIYYSDFRPFNTQMNKFLGYARELAEAKDGDLRLDLPQFVAVGTMGPREILKTHGLVYSLLRREALAGLNRFLLLAAILWICTLALVAVEVPLIFRPMAGRTAHSLRALDAARQNAEEELAKEAERDDKIVYLRIMGHEIRTPLNAILGTIQLLRMNDLPAKQAEYAEQIEKAARHLVLLVDQVLDFRELEADLVRLEIAPVSLSEQLELVVADLRSFAEERGLEVSCRIDEGLAEYYLADGDRIRKILNHLVGNAIKFTEEGSVSVRIRYLGPSGATADFVRFEVQDTGIGVPELLQEQIFREWRQADDSLVRKYGGTGLGLPIAWRIVQLMDGEMGVESKEGKGSLFWFTVPLERLPGRPVMEKGDLYRPVSTK